MSRRDQQVVSEPGDYDLWSMRMKQYLTHTDYALWEVIMNGDPPAAIASVSGGAEAAIPPKTTKQNIARRNELKEKSTPLLAISNEHLLKFHGIKDAKTLWEVSETHRQLEIHDTLAMDLYNNLKVCKAEIKGQSSSSSNSQNVAFVSSDNTSSTNEAVNTTHNVSAASSQGQASASTYADDVMFSFFANQSNSSHAYHEGEEIHKENKKESKFQWKKTIGFVKTKVECYICHMRGKSVLNNEGKDTGQRKVRPVWNNAQRVNHQNFSTHPHPKRNFVSTAVITNSDKVPVNTAKQSSPRTTTSTSTARYDPTNSDKVPVNTAKQSSPRTTTSTSTARYVNTATTRRTFNQRTTPKNHNLKEKINTAKVNNVTTTGTKAVVSVVQRNGENVVKHMMGNKSFLIDYQEINGGFVAFGGSPKGVLLKVPRQNNMYSFDLKNVVPSGEKKEAQSLLSSNLEFMRHFGCPVTILNTLDHVGKFERKADEGFLVGYFVNSKAFRVFNSKTRKVEENLHIKFLENKSNVAGRGPEWLFDIDLLTKSMNYEPITTRNQTNDDAGIEINVNVGKVGWEKASDHEFILLPFMHSNSSLSLSTQSSDDKDTDKVLGKGDEGVSKGSEINDQERTDSSTQDVNTIGPSINTANTNINIGSLNINTVGSNDPSMSSLEETAIFDDVYDDKEVGAEADTNYLELSTVFSPILTTRVHKDHPKEQIIRDLNLSTQIMRMINFSKENAMVSYINKQKRTNHKDYQNYLFVGFLSQQEPKKEEGTGIKWVFRNKKNERGIVVRNKARLVAQGYNQEEGIDYDEVFALVARIEAIGLFLAYASFMGFIVYQIDVKSVFLYGIIEEEAYVCELPSFEDPHFPNKVYKVEKSLYGLHQDPRACDIIFGFTKKFLCDEFEQMMHKTFQMSSMEELTFFLGLQTASTPMEPNKALIKDAEAEDVDVHLYRSIIISLMYLTASRPDIMFVVCACAKFQVTPKTSHLYAVKRIFRYLKGLMDPKSNA
nr:hypothetical protein [Tanacetum cinerariifolium]